MGSSSLIVYSVKAIQKLSLGLIEAGIINTIHNNTCMGARACLLPRTNAHQHTRTCKHTCAEDSQLLSTIWCEWWNSATGIAIPGSVFDPLPAVIRWCSTGYRWLFTFLLLNQEHSLNNKCSQSVQSIHHSKWSHRMWPYQKDCRTQNKNKNVSST